MDQCGLFKRCVVHKIYSLVVWSITDNLHEDAHMSWKKNEKKCGGYKMALNLVVLERKRKRVEHGLHLSKEEKEVMDSAPDFVLQSEAVSHEECPQRVVQMFL